jgi:transposase
MDVILGKERRRWSEDQKREIVAETLAPGETVTGVARRHGANPSMVFSWRKRLIEEQRAHEAPQPAFMPIALAPCQPGQRAGPVQEGPPANAAPDAPTIDVAFACGARLRVTGAVDPDLVAGIVKALKRA